MSKKPLERRERLPERKKARIVLDTNVLISAWLWDGDEARVVELVERGVLEAYTSPKLLEELDRALRYSKLGLTDEEADSAIGY
ncbi:MAG: putative toxin-antitoxin system toxin component, PIN family, partial [Candidatus Bathyarchaeia archaeon]